MSTARGHRTAVSHWKRRARLVHIRPMLQDIAELERASEGEAEIDSLREQVFEALLQLARRTGRTRRE